MVSGRRPSKTRGFLRFSKRPRDPLRTLGWSTFENSWFFAIFNSPARPSADFGLVGLRKLVVFCDFHIARATLCGLWAGRPSKTRGFLRFSNRPRDRLWTLGWSTFENSWFFAIFKSPARPSAQFRVVESLSLRRGTRFLAAVNSKPLPSQGDLLQSALDVSSKPLPSHWDCFASDMLLSTFFIELLLSNFLFKNFVFEAFFMQIRDPVDNSLRLRNAPLSPQRS